MGSFQKATRRQLKLRMALDGPAKSGKSLTSLRFAFALAKHFGGKVAAIDTENKSLSKYQGIDPDGVPFEFDVCELANYAPTTYTDKIIEAGREGYCVLIIDSLSHAWAGEGGALELKDQQGGNSFAAWKNITPMHNRMIEAILKSPCHVIATMRSKMEYILEADEKGRMVPRKIGMAPVQRSGMEYEFDVYGSLDHTHLLKVTGSRCEAIEGAGVIKPGADFMSPLIQWLETGTRGTPKPTISNEQIQRIDELASALEITANQMISGLRKAYGIDVQGFGRLATAYAFLTQEQADDLERRLHERMKIKQQESAHLDEPNNGNELNEAGGANGRAEKTDRSANELSVNEREKENQNA